MPVSFYSGEDKVRSEPFEEAEIGLAVLWADCKRPKQPTHRSRVLGKVEASRG